GVATRQLGRVFEPFHRGDGALVRRTAGTGIGLALVRGLVERMGGAVEGRNAPGGGFEVRLHLPAA
ncbi:MAG: ATP-binding protein, partial [Myxococcota bacterium]|nr:ATP-binding protein [Myxococcota bacterium]